VYFKYDGNLYEKDSKIIFSIIHDYYRVTAYVTVKTGVVVSYQSFGDLMRWNPCSSCTAGPAREFAEGKLHHSHCLVSKGGIDEAGSFHHIPIKDTSSLTEIFRRRVLNLFVDRRLTAFPFHTSRYDDLPG
jgi:hypothetical protein